jgi:hypothetical protein
MSPINISKNKWKEFTLSDKGWRLVHCLPGEYSPVHGINIGAERNGYGPDWVDAIMPGDGRRGCMTLFGPAPFTWAAHLEPSERIECLDCGNFFQAFIDAMLGFLLTGRSPIDPAETLEIAALVQTSVEAIKTPDTWVNVAQPLHPGTGNTP